MALNTQAKQEIINKHQTHGTDTGSAEVQVAMLSEKINLLSSHLQSNSHDFSSRQGLLKMIGQRKRLLNYVKGKSQARYNALLTKLKIRG
ncbi:MULTISPECIES: 30S ribosomal protein S15 [unclassified Prochlorococcus]|uniref:30S ribosomal protein S15 n=1 Tax=unclassified Prochlorococcus TaxID=2627481 RepID=UPI0005339A3D|nr:MULTISPECIES: 30S ribosomal protein S15 [unclassified Prochlorococcus]KGG15066.1 SSU ribosomal protein S15p (S13e) [Prochlorococcus sp. MIT 0602]KGG17338.1 SSU ribosomal protein S15p (S13e) [Prochlorococcus sp. MIT 0603]